MENTNTKWFTVPVIIALVIGLIAGYVAGFYRANLFSTVGISEVFDNDDDEDAENVSGTAETEVVTVSAADQLAGAVANVSDVKLDKVAWLAVKNYTDGKLGAVLGAHRLPAGTYATDKIELVKPTVAGHTYAVVVLYDNGDLAFNSATDILVEVDGAPVMAVFSAE